MRLLKYIGAIAGSAIIFLIMIYVPIYFSSQDELEYSNQLVKALMEKKGVDSLGPADPELIEISKSSSVYGIERFHIYRNAVLIVASIAVFMLPWVIFSTSFLISSILLAPMCFFAFTDRSNAYLYLLAVSLSLSGSFIWSRLHKDIAKN